MNVILEIGRDGYDEDIKVKICPFCQKNNKLSIFFIDYTTHPLISCEECEGLGFFEADIDNVLEYIVNKYPCIEKGKIKEKNEFNEELYWDLYEVPLIKVIKVALPELQTYSQSKHLTDGEIWSIQNAETEDKRKELISKYKLIKFIDYYPSCNTIEDFNKLNISTVSISPTYNLGYFESLKGDRQIIYITENNTIIRSWAD